MQGPFFIDSNISVAQHLHHIIDKRKHPKLTNQPPKETCAKLAKHIRGEMNLLVNDEFENTRKQ